MFAPYVPRTQEVPKVAICLTHGLVSNKNDPYLEAVIDRTKSKPIFNSNVDPSVIIDNCAFQNFKLATVEDVNCSSYFNVEQRTEGIHNCYLFEPKNRTEYNLLKLVTSPNERRFIYQMSLVKSISQLNRILPLIYFKSSPDFERFYATDLDISMKNNHLLFFSYSLLEIIKLPYPYDTNCVNEEKNFCHQNANNTIKFKCKSTCRDNLTITHVELFHDFNEGIYFQIGSLGSPVSRVNFVEKIRFKSFLIQLASLLSLWLSVSVVLFSEKIIDFSCFTLKSHKKGEEDGDKRISKLHQQLIALTQKARVHFTILSTNVTNEIMQIHTLKTNFRLELIKTVTKVAIISLYLTETFNLTKDYFAYSTRMDIRIEVAANIDYPSLSHCIDMVYWVKMSKPKYFEKYDQTFVKFLKKFNHTIEEAFNMVPSVDSFITRCRVRNSVDAPLILYKNCSEFFEVKKFWQANYMCYLSRPKFDYKFDATKAIQNTDQPGVLYSIVINEKLASITHFLPIVSYQFPYVSRFLSSRLYKQMDKQLTALSFATYEYQQLPKPYETGCTPVSSLSQCDLKCINFTKINRTPYSELHYEPIPKYPVNYVDMKNNETANYVLKVEKYCQKICRIDCKESISKTFESYAYSSRESLELAVLMPKSPIYSFEAIPVYTFSTFIYQMACCASFWLGFSIIKMNKLFSHHHEKVKNLTRHIYLNNLVNQLEKSLYSNVKTKKNYFLSTLKKRLIKRKVETFFFLIVTLGFFIHTFDTASYYFKYQTSMDTRINFESNFTELFATICLKIDQLDLKDDYSVINIFSKSPKVDEILLECGHRGVNLDNLSHLPPVLKQRILPFINSTEVCNKLFRIRKVLTFGMVCYMILPGPKTQNAEFTAKYQIFSVKTYEYFTIRQTLSKYNLTITASQKPPSLSLFLSAKTQAIDPSKSYWYWVSYIKFWINVLPYPYNMDVYIGIQHQSCVRYCLAGAALKIGKVSPYGKTYNSTSLLKHETLEESMSTESTKAREKCERQCESSRFYGSLRRSYFETYTDGPYDDTIKSRKELGTIGYWFRNSDFLVTHTKFFPELRVLDLILYIGSIFSIWFGFSTLELADWFFNIPSNLLNDFSINLIEMKLKKIHLFLQYQNKSNR